MNPPEFKAEEFVVVEALADAPFLLSEFYVLEYLVREEKINSFEPYFNLLVKQQDYMFQRYCLYALTREFRHYAHQGPESEHGSNFRILSFDVKAAFSVCQTDKHDVDANKTTYHFNIPDFMRKANKVLTVLDNPLSITRLLQNLFYDDGWANHFGGETWGHIADILEARLLGKLSPVVFIDTCWHLEHNSGSFIDKAPVPHSYYNMISPLLDLKAESDLLCHFYLSNRHVIGLARPHIPVSPPSPRDYSHSNLAFKLCCRISDALYGEKNPRLEEIKHLIKADYNFK